MPSTSPRRFVSAVRSIQLVGLSLLVLLLSGCYSHYGYQGQYGGGGPGYYGQPMHQGPGYPNSPTYNMTPGQPLGNGGVYTPGGTAPGMSPTPLGAPPSTYDNNGPSIRFENPNNNAPEFNANPGTVPGRGSVPEPGDELNNNGPGASKPTLQPTSATEQDGLTTPFKESANSNGASSGARVQPAQVTEEADPFEMPDRPQPLRSSATSGATAIQRVSYEEPQPAKLNPFGRDLKHANPTWLRGVIDYDQKLRTWTILYSANPDARDPNGGCLTLAPHPSLAKCRLGEVVLAEGAIDATQSDARGKPLYVLDNVTPLKAQ